MARAFSTSFDTVAEFSDRGFFIEPQNQYGTASHELSTEQIHSSGHSHKGWIYAANTGAHAADNHRAYPTVQLHKLPGGGFRTPCSISLWVWLDVTFQPGEWFSLANLARSTDDAFWDGVLVNVNDKGFLELMHVPTQGQGARDFQDDEHPFPMRRWVNLSIQIDMDAAAGYARAYVDGQLRSAAPVRGGHGILEQAHFGLYAPPTMAAGVVYNDDLVIREAR